MAVIRFKRKVRQSGGSAAIAIPPEVMDALKWKVGDDVELFIEDQKLTIKKA